MEARDAVLLVEGELQLDRRGEVCHGRDRELVEARDRAPDRVLATRATRQRLVADDRWHLVQARIEADADGEASVAARRVEAFAERQRLSFRRTEPTWVTLFDVAEEIEKPRRSGASR